MRPLNDAPASVKSVLRPLPSRKDICRDDTVVQYIMVPANDNVDHERTI